MFVNAVNDKMIDEHFQRSFPIVRNQAINGIQKSLDEFGVDVIMGPTDGRIASIAASAGCPVATVPLGYADFNGRAFGMNIIASAGKEKEMFQVMSAWEATFPDAVQSPPMLVNRNEQKPSHI